MENEEEILKSTREKWRDIYGYHGIYQVSSHGNVKNIKRNRLLTVSVTRDGYSKVALIKKVDGKTKIKNELIHRLVGLAFVPIGSFERTSINHIDGVKSNNHSYNLEWVTTSENNQHFVKTLKQKYKFADENNNTKLEIHQVNRIRQFYDLGRFTQAELAAMYNVSQSAISQIVNVKIRKQEKYNKK